MLTRRETLKVVPAALAVGSLPTLASCTATGGIDPAILADVANKVQQAVAQACAEAGNIVPTVTSILGLLRTLSAGLSASINAATAALTIAEQIIGQVCPAPVVGQPRRLKAGDPNAPLKVVVNGVDVDFIVFQKRA